MTGCTNAEDTPDTNNSWNVIDKGTATFGLTMYKVVKIEGHRYIVFRAIKAVSAIHSESCSCKSM